MVRNNYCWTALLLTLSFIHFLGGTSPSLQSLQKILKCLPISHKVTLNYILEHLNRVSQQHSQNSMPAYNLASVLAPSVIIHEDMTFVTLQIAADIVELLIKNYRDIDCLRF